MFTVILTPLGVIEIEKNENVLPLVSGEMILGENLSWENAIALKDKEEARIRAERLEDEERYFRIAYDLEEQ